ncbi:hypothetical protein SLEP1_g21711 [Rubroshorea leprosula]|uniref:Uncharacterized protein n=1 Tax=Rubroshorea leprosula TaxID=152421 RepID=A0AAV5J6V1_9ROSI|nr:hypothetical protein SLEP1_g21711 [Rubroshorea leprosula]
MQLRDRKLSARLKKLWTGVAARLGFRKSGLVKLRNDVRSCEYEDVHVLWEMLKKSELEHSPRKNKKGQFCNCFEWAKHSSLLSRSF